MALLDCCIDDTFLYGISTNFVSPFSSPSNNSVTNISLNDTWTAKEPIGNKEFSIKGKFTRTRGARDFSWSVRSTLAEESTNCMRFFGLIWTGKNYQTLLAGADPKNHLDIFDKSGKVKGGDPEC